MKKHIVNRLKRRILLQEWMSTRNAGQDARLFTKFGIPSFDLLVGYLYQHTNVEQLDVQFTLDTIRLRDAWFQHHTVN